MDFRWSIVCSLLLVFASSSNAKSGHRVKRNLHQLEELIQCGTDRKAQDYINYGCWCGLGGGGEPPVDGVDSCCMAHDKCYDDLLDNGRCEGLDLYLKPYHLPPQYGEDCPTLNEDYCDTLPKSCKCIYGLCRCDFAFVGCLRGCLYDKKRVNYGLVGCSFKKFMNKIEDFFRRG